MKFLVVLLAVVYVAQAQLAGGFEPQTVISDQVMEIARWSTTNLASQLNVAGSFTTLTVKNLMTQVVAGVNYKFDLDVLYATPDNKYFVKNFLFFFISF